MPTRSPMIRSAFNSWEDEFSGRGKRPVVFDILGPDRETSILPPDLFLVLHTNPKSMKFTYQKNIVRIQTRGGWVEQHWGDSVEEINFDVATGGFMRLRSGLSNKTGTGLLDSQQARRGRRETIQYDKYLDFLALFKNNGAVYDARGNIAAQGYIKIIFDGGVHIGWFNTLSVTEAVEQPYQFALSANFQVDEELMVWRSTAFRTGVDMFGEGTTAFPETSQEPIFDEFSRPRGFV